MEQDARRRAPRRKPVLLAGVTLAAVVVGAGAFLTLRHPTSVASQTPAVAATPLEVSPSPSPTASAGGPLAFSDLYRQDSDGVIRIETTACDGGGVGSGFLLAAPDLVATVAHV
jgi:serine protease Do